MKKRIIGLVLAVLMVMCLLPASALADNAASGKCGDNLTWKLDENGTLTVSGMGTMYDYENGAPWDKEAVRGVIIGEGVESLGERALSGLSKVESVYLPKSLKSIGSNALDSEASANLLSDIYFGGTEEQWKVIGGELAGVLDSTEIHFNCPLFDDVANPALYYYDPVMWAVTNDITNGMGDGKFMPESTCTRGQLVTLLWRLAGSRSVDDYSNPFADVKEGAYYYDAVIWAVSEGVTEGVDAAHFAPDAAVTRCQVVTFLWRMAGSYAVKADNIGFDDVSEGAYYYHAVAWAVKRNITNGMGGNTFAPDAGCTRGQTMTFLFRDRSGK